MKRIWLHRLFVVLLLLLTIAATWGALQFASFQRDDFMWDLSSARFHRQIGIKRGGLVYMKVDLSDPSGGAPVKHQYALLGSAYQFERRQLVNPQMQANPIEPTERSSPVNASTIAMTSVDVRLWKLAVLFGVYPLIVALAALRRWARLKRNPNACRKCFYDLTGNKSGNCPECGQSVPEMRVAVK